MLPDPRCPPQDFASGHGRRSQARPSQLALGYQDHGGRCKHDDRGSGKSGPGAEMLEHYAAERRPTGYPGLGAPRKPAERLYRPGRWGEFPGQVIHGPKGGTSPSPARKISG